MGGLQGRRALEETAIMYSKEVSKQYPTALKTSLGATQGIEHGFGVKERNFVVWDGRVSDMIRRRMNIVAFVPSML